MNLLGRCCQEVKRRNSGVPVEALAGSGVQLPPNLPLPCTFLPAGAVLICQLPGAKATAHTGGYGREHTPMTGSFGVR